MESDEQRAIKQPARSGKARNKTRELWKPAISTTGENRPGESAEERMGRWTQRECVASSPRLSNRGLYQWHDHFIAHIHRQRILSIQTPDCSR